MRIIGVIDLLGGRVVHAQGGCRHRYRPIDVAGGVEIRGDGAMLARLYREHLGLDDLYVADLDAIEGGAEQDREVRVLTEQGGCLWLDAGVSTVAQARRALDRGASFVIVGLETLPSFSALTDIVKTVGTGRAVFSVDVRDGRPVAGTEALRELPPSIIAARAVDAGVTSLIVLDLARVGSGQGADVTLVEAVRRAAPSVTLLAGGGIRNGRDLIEVASAGADGALVGTALHGPGAVDLVRSAAGRLPITNT